MALKMGVCLSAASFAHLAMTGILKGMGVSGGRLFLGSFFFGDTKKNEHLRVQGIIPAFLPHNENKKITAIQTAMWRNENTLHCLYGCRISTQIHQKGSYDISDAGVIPTI